METIESTNGTWANILSWNVLVNFHCQSIVNNGTFFTDSNGLGMIRRDIKNHSIDSFSHNVSGNFYPVSSAIRIEDSDLHMSIFNDRS